MKVETVLLVDDDENILVTTAMVLEDRWKVIVASSGVEAIMAVERARPDLILLDVMMPDMDGPGLFLKLKALEEFASIPVIFITAKVQAAEIANYLGMGAAGVIAKPFDPTTLIDDICRLVLQKELAPTEI